MVIDAKKQIVLAILDSVVAFEMSRGPQGSCGERRSEQRRRNVRSDVDVIDAIPIPDILLSQCLQTEKLGIMVGVPSVHRLIRAEQYSVQAGERK